MSDDLCVLAVVVTDTRSCLDWLAGQGYKRIGILGTSLGSCVAFIAAAHDARVKVGIFNHVSMNFSDVVWNGLSTQNVRQGFGDTVSLEELRRYWSVISPASYLERLPGRDLKSLLVWARARQHLSFQSIRSKCCGAFKEMKLPHWVFTLPCGHSYRPGSSRSHGWAGDVLIRAVRTCSPL